MRIRLPLSTTAWIFPAITDRLANIFLFAALSLPLAVLGYDVLGELNLPGSRLGADPAQAIVHRLGEWSIWMLLATLSVSTLRHLSGRARLLRFRRMVGLFAFGYLCLHFLAYLVYLADLDWQLIVADLSERPYITVGFLGLLLLVPLAVTSTNGWRRRLGARWQLLHRLIYVVVPLGLIHHYWLTKDDYAETVLYALLFALLMLERLVRKRRSGLRSPPTAP